MSTRNGKIGRLSSGLRHLVCLRLENGETNKSVAEWLNRLPEVQELLRASFDSRPISEQNMSEWKNGGFVEWQRLQETRDLAQQIAEDGELLDLDSEGECFSDRLGLKLAVELAHLMTQLVVEEQDPEKKWQRLQDMNRELSRLRRDDHRAAKLKMERQDREKQERAEAQAELKRKEEQNKNRVASELMAPVNTRALVDELQLAGYGRNKRQRVAEVVYRIRNDLPWQEYAERHLPARGLLAQKGPQTPENPGQSN